MIGLFTLMLLSAPPPDAADLRDAEEEWNTTLLRQNTQSEIDYCSGSENDQPFTFCLADRRFERGDKELKDLIPKIRFEAISQRNYIVQLKKQGIGVTLGGDPVRAFESAQKQWKISSAMDCLAVGLSQATGNAGTRGVTVRWECEADRIFDRIEFLRRMYFIKD